MLLVRLAYALIVMAFICACSRSFLTHGALVNHWRTCVEAIGQLLLFLNKRKEDKELERVAERQRTVETTVLQPQPNLPAMVCGF